MDGLDFQKVKGNDVIYNMISIFYLKLFNKGLIYSCRLFYFNLIQCSLDFYV